ncbi:sulfate adenylyltransferase subunit 2 [Allokutzneria sp. A3M-2-11 16]|uniref:sulfate adenylyltransferase subunit CysD n=1 Tax=Allokutzneria sp. A3M-2-11 16 TaxID=2962043 RepID=UPI0020B7CE0B|nr:sulfate adenylyltransferase subunit CysD [Allokutzneria sp. A3M-2-11 16]MCP3798469.1 sulfate adenylyltransferase subunit 2 [Allokutzneria sp. A3M-2-11 16]
MTVVDRLDQLEAESIHIIREAVAAAEKPVLLFSGGKDSAVLLHLVAAAFAPGPLPMPLLHVDTGHNFPEVLAYRDDIACRFDARLLVASVEDALREGVITAVPGEVSRNRLQIPVLKAFLGRGEYDVVLGGARRDEDKARAKERVFSVRGSDQAWRPEQQRPELWDIYNATPPPDGSVRVFPLSNWTERDIWKYVPRRAIVLPPLYYAHERDIVVRDGALVPLSDVIQLGPGEKRIRGWVRFRTVGDVTCTAAVASAARTAEEVLAELAGATVSERAATRLDDRGVGGTAMEERKRAGYF